MRLAALLAVPLLATLLCTAVPPSGAPSADGHHPAGAPPGSRAADPQAVKRAVKRGLKYLRRHQDPVSGGWIADVGYKFNSEYHRTARQKPHVGVTALALMAFLSGGHLPGRGEYGDTVVRGTDYILRCVDPTDGYISDHGTRMYSHAFATLFLAEIYGETHRSDLRSRLQQAVNLTVRSQNKHGSWRYLPHSPNSDMSITVCQIMALRAARNIGLRVPRSTIARAQDYVERSAITRVRDHNYGGFRYQEQEGSRTTFALTSAGIATLYHSGVYDEDNPFIRAGIGFLRRKLRSFSSDRYGHYFYWYGHYYASQAFFIAEENPKLGRPWSTIYWPYISSELVRRQRMDGSWANNQGPGNNFSTAVACIILQIPNQYLPIFQR